ncbi:polysaccharide deacetylase family protein [Planosporangium sp. 12N6]|uniref:polysaccharide deacetylase family protein n=1 Tax=Planosporangium spinosum TaxID=3402278 RepID=UPI003CEB6375
MPPYRTHARVLGLVAGAVGVTMLAVALGVWFGDHDGHRPAERARPRANGHPIAAVRSSAARPSIAPAVALPAAVFTPGAIAKTTGTEAVALTFDDGPGPQTMPMLDLLRTWGVKATFCLIGENVQEHPELVQAIVRDGHALCNHTWNHDLSLGQRSPDEIRADLQRTNDEIRKAVPGAPVKYFRHPGGNFTPTAVQVAQDLGMTSIDWDTDPTDWDTATYGVGPMMVNQIVQTVTDGVKPGSIVLSHDGGGDRTSTVAAYGKLLPYLTQERHLRLVPLPN